MTEPATLSALMDKLAFTQVRLARIYSDLGDPTPIPAITRRIRRRLQQPESHGETVAFLTLLLRIKDATDVLGTAIPGEARNVRRRRSSDRK